MISFFLKERKKSGVVGGGGGWGQISHSGLPVIKDLNF